MCQFLDTFNRNGVSLEHIILINLARFSSLFILSSYFLVFITYFSDYLKDTNDVASTQEVIELLYSCCYC